MAAVLGIVVNFIYSVVELSVCVKSVRGVKVK
jgi:hypothetical protein